MADSWLTVRRRRAAMRVVYFTIAIGGFEALYGLVQAVGGVDYIGNYLRGQGRVASGTLIHPNHYAGLLNMTLALAVGVVFAGFAESHLRLRSASEAGARAWIQLLGCALIGFGAILSRSRGGVLTLLAMLCFVAIVLAIRRPTASAKLPAWAGGALLVVVLGLGLSVGLGTFLSSFAGIPTDHRIAIFTDSIHLIGDHPAGIGPGMYSWRIQQYQTANVNRHYVHAHNDYLEIAADWGLPIAALFWGFVVWRFWRTLRSFFLAPTPWEQGLSLGCAAAILTILLHSTVDFNLHIPINLMIFCSILGLSWSVDSVRHFDRGESSE